MRLSWQHVVVIALVLAGVVTLAALGRDTTALTGLGVMLLVGLGLMAGQQQQIKEQTNGTQTKLLQMVEELAKRQMSEPRPTDPPAETDKP
jgi:hypothetical protein